jgi:predicted amidophosphoribosyltransferase
MVKCKSCDHDLDKDANFCSHCGLRTEKGMKNGIKTPVDGRASWEKEVQDALETATKKLEEGFKIALESLREAAEGISSDISERREMRRSKPTRKKALYCTQCGAKNDSDAVYCTKCGKELPR